LESKEVLELITALVDNEIETNEKAKEIKLIIKNSQKLNLEYQLQNFVKSTIKSCVPKVEPPEYLKQEIVTSLIKEIEITNKKKENRSHIFQWVLRPAFVFSVILSVIAVIFYFSQNKIYENIAFQQKGKSNMVNQALHNFQSIMEGSLLAQISPVNVEELKTFFRNRGMNYDVPSAKDWYLSGAAVSEISGKKFAHNIYRNASGKIAYLFQANEDFLIKQKIFNLSDDLIKLVNGGKCYKYNDQNKSVMVWKCRKNICILVSNDNMNNLNQFIASR
jgi:hypothetical protein